MPSERTLTELVTTAKRLADQFQAGTGPALVVTADAEERAQESLASLYEMIIREGGSELLKKRVTITATAATAPYFEVLLPADFYKLIGIQHVSGTDYRPIHRLRPEDESQAYALTGEPRWYSLENVATAEAAPLLIFPRPTSALVFDVQYLPEAPLASAGDDEPDVGITLPNRWWQWVQYDMAAGFAQREEDATLEQALTRRRDEIGAAIMRSATATDYAEPRRIRDVRGIVRNPDREPWRRNGDFA